ncbi:MAG: hypothetical protein K8R87_01410 [Verrucomicrobia bacterium]|nr:hypothetical protein [Verrucomicrobiota bacterium]
MQKLPQSRTDWTGREIVGVWVSKFDQVAFGGLHFTLLLRPDGTGLMRERGGAQVRATYDVKWRYAGGGLWKGIRKVQPGNDPWLGYQTPLEIHYTGKELLVEFEKSSAVLGKPRAVFVPADDTSAVDEHLRKRQ